MAQFRSRIGQPHLLASPLYEVTPFIEQQLAKWTKEGMSKRIELAIGRDPQFMPSMARSGATGRALNSSRERGVLSE